MIVLKQWNLLSCMLVVDTWFHCPLLSSQMGRPRLCPTNLWRLPMYMPLMHPCKETLIIWPPWSEHIQDTATMAGMGSEAKFIFWADYDHTVKGIWDNYHYNCNTTCLVANYNMKLTLEHGQVTWQFIYKDSRKYNRPTWSQETPTDSDQSIWSHTK